MNYSDYCWDTETGVFRQRDLTVTAVYDQEYLRQRYVHIDSAVRALAARRLRVLDAFVPERGRLLDFGAGTFRFVEHAAEEWDAWGYDLVDADHPRQDYSPEHKVFGGWDVVTFFDSLEHLERPTDTIHKLDPNYIFVSVPWCHFPRDESWFMNWKHRRPGEHLWHFNDTSLDLLMRTLGYQRLMSSSFEDDFRPRYDPALPNILSAIYRRRP